MRAEALKGHLEGMLLAILSEHPLHGYAVVEELRSRSGGRIDLPTGTLYPALHRLEQAGLIASDWSEGTGRRRRVYTVTPTGTRALTAQRRSWEEMAAVISQVMDSGLRPA